MNYFSPSPSKRFRTVFDSGAGIHGVQRTKTNDHAMLRRVSDALQGFREGVQCDLCSDSDFLFEHLEYWRLVAVGELKLELCVRRSTVVLGILTLHDSARSQLIPVFFGALLAEHLESELAAPQ